MKQHIEEAMMRALSKMNDHRSGIKSIDEFADNTLIAMGAMAKSLGDLKDLDAPDEVTQVFLDFIETWKDLCAVTMKIITDKGKE